MEKHRPNTTSSSTVVADVNPTSTLQRLRERARSVDRYLSNQRLNLNGTPKLSRGTSSARSNGETEPPTQPQPPPPSQPTRKSRPQLSRNTGHVRQPSQRWRSPSINNRLQQNLQNLVSYLFERKNDAKKRALAERLLWTALRRNEIDLLRDILNQLQDPPIDLNRKNEFGWNLVDEAVMLGFNEIARELFQRGCKESEELRQKSQRQEVLKRALRGLEAVQAASRMNENASTQQLAADVATGPTFAIVQQMVQFVEKTRPPRNYLEDVTVQTWGESAVALHYRSRTVPSGVISRFRVEWSRDPNFESDVDFEIFHDVVNPEHLIVEGLLSGEPYYLRLSAANLAGFGMPVTAHPSPVVITSWRDVEDVKSPPLLAETLPELERILKTVENMEHMIKNSDKRSTTFRAVQRRPSLKDSIKSIIKTTQGRSFSMDDGGLFLGSLIVTEDNVLLTSDSALPVCLVQSPFLGTISAKQFLWLQKLCSVPSLATPLKELLHSSRDSTSDIRYSMIQAITGLQSLLATDDLGAPYFRTLYNVETNVTLLLLMRRIVSLDLYKAPPGFKWIHVKEAELLSIGPCDHMLALLSSVGINELLAYIRAACATIPPGLHLGFVQLQPSLDNVSVVLSKARPNVLPAVFVRSNPHVDMNEWIDLLKHNPKCQDVPYTPINGKFRSQILNMWLQLKHHLSLMSVEEPYIYEKVVQLSPESTMIVLYSDLRGLAARQSLDEELRRGALSMAVQTLESNHLETYQKELWHLYCQSSLLLDALTVYLHQRQREAFHTDEQDIKQMLLQLQFQQDRLEHSWSNHRWLPDVIRAVTGRHSRRLPLLYPVRPSGQTLPKKSATAPQLPPKPSRLTANSPNASPSTCTKKDPDQLSVTVAIQPKFTSSKQADSDLSSTPSRGPNREHIDAYAVIKINGNSTAEDVVRLVLMRSVGSLASKLVPFYGLGVWVEGRQIFLKSSDIVSHYSSLGEAQFFLIRQEDES
ncbi:putative Ankyrin repeat and fibronectin type-III domain-containing protein 1 [Hypsibius exemplaris]|uniref:Ankyrin repeat and fibronectin type-III domain-containing protein 1 n=1 Tax=Hypsibius exemplaris TaxID=2072580 RepID=A0A1W0WAS9_HYPEX|nr:putative Ankyrin repeat and fibronectin type-III domain-containing protein 1 [Hypsibius exemplaris]